MNQWPHPFPWSAVLLIILVTFGQACSIPGLTGNNQPITDQNRPVVALSSPSAEENLEPGSEVKIQSTSVDEEGVVRVELLIDGEVVQSDINPQPQPGAPYIVLQTWTPNTPGGYVIQVRAFNADNVVGQSEPLMVEVGVSAQAIAAEADGSPTIEADVNTPPNTPTPTKAVPSPSDTPLPQPTTLSAEPTATTAPTTTPTVTATPTSTPTPGAFDPTGIEPEGLFKDIWHELGGGDSRLGYPTIPEINDRNFAKQYFEKGFMYWWDNPDGPNYIWAIDSPAADLQSGLTWNRYVDEWDGGDIYACEAASSNGAIGPVRGFGKIWCERPELQIRLGNPHELEAGSGDNPPYGHIQFFQGGVMLFNPLNAEAYVLFNQGDWLRFVY